MLAYLQGKFTYKSPALVYLDVHGVGYEVNISLHTYEAIRQLEEGRLYTYWQVKEDGNALFGFADRQEKDIFLLLIAVSGVGAATARMMLSTLRPSDIQQAVLEQNVKLLESVKGIGRKTAERLVLELKDKLLKHSPVSDITTIPGNSLQQDALTALSALGISRQQAETAIQKVLRTEPGTQQLEVLIKKALQAI